MEATTKVTPANYLSHPSTQRLQVLAPCDQHRSPKMRAICKDLLQNPGSTRQEVMSRVNPQRSASSNKCYFRRIHADYASRCHDEARYSVIINGLVRVSGRTRTGRLTYEVTELGARVAQDLA